MAPFSWRAVLRDYLLILVGVSLTALGLVWFLIPNKIAAGGVSGLATIAYYLWGLPVGLSMLVLNLPLFLACVREFGMRFGLRTLFGTVFLSVMVELWTTVIHAPLTEHPFLAAL